jgi:hypothetical protein
MELRRLNGDTSWLLTCGAEHVAIDPWLQGVEVDGCACFNAAALGLPAALPGELGPLLTCILLTQGFSDHCHEETLLALGGSCPIYAVPAALSRLRSGPAQALAARAHPLEALAARLGPGWKAERITPPLLAPTHGGVLLVSPSGSVVLAPHGVEAPTLPGLAAQCAQCPRPLVVVATTSTFALPWWLGGTVNLGLSSAAALCDALRADVFHATHDEQKLASGCVLALAARRYPRAEEVCAAIPAFRSAPCISSGLAGPACALQLHHPPPFQLSLEDGLFEACRTACTLRRLALSAPPSGPPVSVQKWWNASAGTYTYHTTVRVPGVAAASGILERVSELFFRAYEAQRHGWYKQFSCGASTASEAALAAAAAAASAGAARASSTRCQWCQGGGAAAESTTGWGVFDMGVGAKRCYHTLFTRRRFAEDGGHAIVLRTVEPPAGSSSPPCPAVQVYLLPPTGDYFVVQRGELQWHHVCTVAGVALLPGVLDRWLMNSLRGCGMDGKEVATYREEGEGFARYVQSLIAVEGKAV